MDLDEFEAAMLIFSFLCVPISCCALYTFCQSKSRPVLDGPNQPWTPLWQTQSDSYKSTTPSSSTNASHYYYQSLMRP